MIKLHVWDSTCPQRENRKIFAVQPEAMSACEKGRLWSQALRWGEKLEIT
jgi:hypothetical protein